MADSYPDEAPSMEQFVIQTLVEEGSIEEAALEAEAESRDGSKPWAYELLDSFESKGIVEEGSAGKWRLVSRQELRRWLDPLTEIDMDVSARLADAEFTLAHVITVPAGFDDHSGVDPTSFFGSESGIEVFTLQKTIELVFEDAEERIRLVSPFLDNYGVELFEDVFITAANRGITLQVHARGLRTDKPDESTLWKARGLLAMLEAYERAGVPERITIRDFHQTKTGSEIVDISIHHKMVMADESSAYVGSGEIRRNSIEKIFEAGHLVLEPAHVREWNRFFDTVWDASEEISKSDLERILSDE